MRRFSKNGGATKARITEIKRAQCTYLRELQTSSVGFLSLKVSTCTVPRIIRVAIMDVEI